MANIASVLKEEITRVVRKELRRETEALQARAVAQRKELATLKRQLAAVEKQLRGLADQPARAAASAPRPDDDASPQRRFSAARLVAQRKRLGLSAEAFGLLLGVSNQSVYKWEAGKARPRAAQLEAIAAARGLSKRQAAEKLATLQANPAPAPATDA